MEAERILFVCTGNTCRSPMAAAMFSSKHRNIETKSAGIQAFPGSPASPSARIAVRDYGGNLDEHESRPLDVSLLEWADRVITMTDSHASQIEERFPQFASKIATLGQASGSGVDISDPVGGELQEYRETARQINEMLEKLFD